MKYYFIVTYGVNDPKDPFGFKNPKRYMYLYADSLVDLYKTLRCVSSQAHRPPKPPALSRRIKRYGGSYDVFSRLLGTFVYRVDRIKVRLDPKQYLSVDYTNKRDYSHTVKCLDMKACKRTLIHYKYAGRCAYTGVLLDSDWQIDHITPKRLYTEGLAEGDPEDIDNLVPAHSIINHYKRAHKLENFRKLLSTLHNRLARLPKEPKTERSKKRSTYLLQVALLFNIAPRSPFSGKFYFEAQQH